MHRVLIAALVLSLVPAALAVTEDFSGPPAGTVVAGMLPLGGAAPGTLFPGFTVTVVNNGGGPHSCIIFDSSNPTGGDPDLGSPNQTCAGGGPGVGVGGQVGEPGENCGTQGNLLIIAEDIGDADNNNIVDDPDDEAGGGILEIIFDDLSIVEEVTILDIDNETAVFTLMEGLILEGVVNATDLGDNSAETIDLSSFGYVTCIRLQVSSSAAVAEVVYTPQITPVETTTWGGVKATFTPNPR